MATEAGEEPKYSRAFENIVQPDGDQEDVVGLVAYALFKKAVREDAANGLASKGVGRNPSATTVKTYRAAAEQLLTEVVSRAIEEATPDIQGSATLAAVDKVRSEITAHIDSRTGFAGALFTNIIAWLVTLAIAALILLLASKPSVEATVAGIASQQRILGK